MKIIDLIYPRRCPVCDRPTPGERLICPECENVPKRVKEPYCLKCGKQLDEDEADRCTNCKTTEHIYDRGRALFLYPGISESIYKFKYGSRPEYSEYYAEEIFKYLGDDIKAWNPDGIIAVPLHTSRMRKRGYN